MARSVEPHSGNTNDAALMNGAAAQIRKLWLDLEAEAKKGETSYAKDGFSEALDSLEGAIAALKSEANRAEENAMEDAYGEIADRAYDNRRDD